VQLAWCRDLNRIPASVNDRYRPNPVGPASYVTATGPGRAWTHDRMWSGDGVSLA